MPSCLTDETYKNYNSPVNDMQKQKDICQKYFFEAMDLAESSDDLMEIKDKFLKPMIETLKAKRNIKNYGPILDFDTVFLKNRGKIVNQIGFLTINKIKLLRNNCIYDYFICLKFNL